MNSIQFTQFMRPDGREKEVLIDRPPQICEIASAVKLAGYRFEIEELVTGEINMEICNDEECLAGELCANGPEVPEAVDRMIVNAFNAMSVNH